MPQSPFLSSGLGEIEGSSRPLREAEIKSAGFHIRSELPQTQAILQGGVNNDNNNK